MSAQIDTSTPEFQNALSLVRFTRQSVFLTGRAGTGKSTFLRYVCEHVRKKHVVLAPTGIAAINAGGCTLHSFFKLPFHPLLPDDPRYAPSRLKDFLKYTRDRIRLIRNVELIIIDEISMVRADIIDFIDLILRVYSGNMREPFGGKQMLLIGDVFQLEPVVKTDERDILGRFYPNAYFFSARVFAQMQLVSVELTKVYRQTDRAFIRVLDHIRCNVVSAEELRLINTRYVPEAVHTVGAEASDIQIVLATRRDTVDYINQNGLDALPGECVRLKGEVQGEFPDTSLPTLLTLEIKPGAQVIFVKNDPEHRWVNGTLGLVSSINEEAGLVHVDIEGGSSVTVEPMQWRNVRYTYNETEKRIEEEELGTFTQFPIRLAWAITIHKSQGLTFRRVTIDFGGGTFAGGQAYVALSRCTSLEGIRLKQKVAPSDVFVRPEVLQFASHFNDEQSVRRALLMAKADTEYQACARAFDEGDFEACLQHFFVAIHTRYDIEQPHVRRLIRRKLNLISTLRRQAQADREALEKMQRRIRKYAREYYELGNICATQAHDLQAAMANFRKAIRMHPTFVDAYVRLGATCLDAGDARQALKVLHKAVALSPASFKAVYQRGRAFMALSLFEQALGDFSRATSLCDTHPNAHQLMGDCFSALGDEEKAELYWEIAAQLRQQKGR